MDGITFLSDGSQYHGFISTPAWENYRDTGHLVAPDPEYSEKVATKLCPVDLPEVKSHDNSSLGYYLPFRLLDDEVFSCWKKINS